MRNAALTFCALAATISLFLSGCDKPEAKSIESTADAPADAPAKAADDAVSASPRKLALKTVPLLLTVPAGWTLEPAQNPAFLLGPGPSGNVRIALSSLDPMSEKSVSAFIRTAQDEGNRHPQRTEIRQSKSAAGLKILSRIEHVQSDGIASMEDAAVAGDPGNAGGASAAGGATSTQPSMQLSWSIMIFVPTGDKFIPCELDLIKLTPRQYTQEQPVVDSIVNSAEADQSAMLK